EKRDIKVTAKKNIELVSEEEDIKITANQGKKGIDIQAKAKDVTIDAEKENVNVSGMKTVVAKAGGPKGPWELKLDNDKSWHVHLGKAGGPGHFLITDDQMKVWWDGENYVELNDDHLYLRNKFAGVELKSNGEVKLDCAGGKQIKFNGTKMTVDK
ncbi:MAG: hypothetical protein QF645_13650, partial [Planctomycetota bacterium]|nr:hypothetical protein [Planctomycetota bacterium]